MNLGKIKLGLILAALAVMLLAGLSLPLVMGGVERLETLRASLERLEVAQSRYRELVIGLRHGVTNNYDEANDWMARIQRERAELAARVASDITLHRIWMPYYKAVRNQETLWNDFKRRNALVRNSLRYFQIDAPRFARALPSNGAGGTLKHELMALNNQLFMQALGEGGEIGGIENSAGITAALARMRVDVASLPGASRAEFERLARHAEIINKHGPALASDVRGLIHTPGRAVLARLAEINHYNLATELARAGRYRAGLLIGVVLLLLALAALSLRYLDSLRRSAREHRLAGTVFESSQQGIIVTDAQGSIVRVNTAYCQMTGYQEHELIGQNPRLLKSGVQDSSYYRTMWASLNETGHWQGELMNRRRNGELYVQWSNIDVVEGEQGEKLFVGITSDISELVSTRERLARLAYFDTLTNLPNRVLFQDRLGHSISQSRREQEKLALIVVDLDNFKTINDTLGHAAGDEMLVEVASRLQARVRDSDTVARLGGDEFALILMDAKGPEAMARIAEEIVVTLAAPYRIMNFDVAGGASLGIAFYPDDGDTLEALLKHADVAMYRAKERGRNNFQFFTDDMAISVADAMRIESHLRHALAAGELSMHYQPQLGADGRILGAEALMRWDSAELGRVPPMRFIPVAEKSGLIAALGDFALHEACRQCASWRRQFAPDFRIAVNLSAAQFRNESLADKVAAALHEFNLPGSALELEITETVVMEDVARGQAILKSLKAQGCRLAIDDFGTGYSSLAYLKRFPVDVLKIDKSFVDGVGVEADDTAVAKAIIGLAQSLRLEVVAEGVETRAQLDCLTHLAGAEGIIAQGYYFSPPLPAAEFERRSEAGGFMPDGIHVA
ncbi:MAG: EAL domain-containing protein [Pseudomonadota bacterium]|nr:EAL domain-containing protein [Pseudomonadota bacterium]MDP1905602.1 EAL domain-containing protein [Pseudomonadota bacterium]MDP2351631.1 EAL domain-containing protein [Pseudomonadota bacterium]